MKVEGNQLNCRNSDFDIFDFSTPNSLLSQYKFSMAINYRKIYIIDDITSDTVFEYMYYLNKIVESDKLCGEKKPIEILVNSGGGSAIDGYSLISLIEQLKDDGYTIITTNIGLAGSMAFAISICGSIRRSYRYSRYMCHDVSFGINGKSQEVVDMLKEASVLRGIYENIIKKYVNISDEEVQEIFEKKIDRYYSPQELMDMNGVDEIL